MSSKRKRKKKEDRVAILLHYNPCCLCGALLLLCFGFFAYGPGWTWFGSSQTDIPPSWTPPEEWWSPPDENTTYYQLGLEFPVRPEDIDVLMISELNTSDHLTFIENINLAPIGLCKSSNDYKPDDMFFLSMFYGDAEYNISFSTVITVGGEQDITVYWNGVAIDEVLKLTWIADGSGTRWDY